MGNQRIAPVAGALALAVVVLTGCVPTTPDSTGPQPPTAEEIAAIREQQAQNWWDSMFFGQDMPEFDVIEELPQAEAGRRQNECLNDAALPGVTVNGAGVTFPAETSDAVFEAIQKQWWLCAQQYPAEPGSFMMSPSQLEWLYDFLAERHRPCLATLGIDVVGFPSRERFLGDSGGYPAWLPYDGTVQPAPAPEGWRVVAERCPLPDLLADYGLPGGATPIPGSQIDE